MSEPDAFELHLLEPGAIRLFRAAPGEAVVRMTREGDRSWREVRIARAFPFSDPDHYLGLRDGSDEDIGVLEDWSALDAGSAALVREELERRYFTPQVRRVLSVDERFGIVTWQVETDRGPHRFIVRSMRDNAYSLGPNRLMVTDTEGNRYEFPDITALGRQAYQVLIKVA